MSRKLHSTTENRDDSGSNPEGMQVFNVRLPTEIILWLDDLTERGIYGSKSEAIRDILRDYLLEARGGKHA